jgi:hypothetical protein
MHSHLSYTLAQQHIDDLRTSADRSRLAAQAEGSRPGFARRLVQIRRAQRRPRAVSSRATLSPNS